MPPIAPGRKKVDNIMLHYGQKYGILIDISFAYPQIHQGRSSHRNVPRIDDNYNVRYLTHKGILADSSYQVLRYGDNLILLSYFVSFNHVASLSVKMTGQFSFLSLVSSFVIICNIHLLL